MKPQPKMRYAGAFAVLLALLAVRCVECQLGQPAPVRPRGRADSADAQRRQCGHRVEKSPAAYIRGHPARRALSVSGFLLQTFFANPSRVRSCWYFLGRQADGCADDDRRAVLRARLGSAVMITAAFAGAMLSMGFVLAHRAARAADAAAGRERRDDRLYLLGGDGFRHYLCRGFQHRQPA